MQQHKSSIEVTLQSVIKSSLIAYGCKILQPLRSILPKNNSVVTNDSASRGNIGIISKSDNHGSNDRSIQHSPAATDPNTNKGESTPDGQASDEIKGNIKNSPSVNPTLHGNINELKNALKQNIKKQFESTPGQ